MDFLDLFRMAVRRWYVAIPAAVIAILASLAVRASVEVTYRSSGSILLLVPRQPDVSKNPMLGYNSLTVPANVVTQIVGSAPTRRKLLERGASDDYDVGIDPTTGTPLVIAVATGTFESAPRTVVLVLEEVDAELRRRQESLGAPPETWITTERVADPEEPSMLTGSRTRAFLAAIVLSLALAAGVTLLVDLLAERRRRRDEWATGGEVPVTVATPEPVAEQRRDPVPSHAAQPPAPPAPPRPAAEGPAPPPPRPAPEPPAPAPAAAGPPAAERRRELPSRSAEPSAEPSAPSRPGAERRASEAPAPAPAATRPSAGRHAAGRHAADRRPEPARASEAAAVPHPASERPSGPAPLHAAEPGPPEAPELAVPDERVPKPVRCHPYLSAIRDEGGPRLDESAG